MLASEGGLQEQESGSRKQNIAPRAKQNLDLRGYVPILVSSYNGILELDFFLFSSIFSVTFS